MYIFVILTLLVSVAIGWLFIPRIVIISKIKRLFDTPDARKVHSGQVPRLGGISFFPASFFSFAFVLGLRYRFGFDITLGLQTELLVELLFVMSGMLVLYFIGLADDLVGLRYADKLVAQLIAASTLVFANVTIFDLQGLFGAGLLPYALDIVLTVVAGVTVINAFNLIDGVDGLCSGLGTITLSVLGVWYMTHELYVYAMFAFSMTGVLITFFLYNVLGSRLKVFMGDTGSLTLGYMIVFLCLKFLNVEHTTYVNTHIHSTMAIVVGLLFVPIFDALRVAVGRMMRRKSPFFPDKTHVHHKLLRLHFTHLQSTAILLVTHAFFIVFNVAMSEWLRLNLNLVIAADVALGIGMNYVLNALIRKRGRDLSDDEVISRER